MQDSNLAFSEARRHWLESMNDRPPRPRPGLSLDREGLIRSPGGSEVRTTLRELDRVLFPTRRARPVLIELKRAFRRAGLSVQRALKDHEVWSILDRFYGEHPD